MCVCGGGVCVCVWGGGEGRVVCVRKRGGSVCVFVGGGGGGQNVCVWGRLCVVVGGGRGVCVGGGVVCV